MTYTLETRKSPNYTLASNCLRVYGVPRTFREIAIHWWGDPATNPSYEGVISTLCNPERKASAHYVATGTRRRVCRLVNEADVSWATNKANPWTISIECDPRCRQEDYEVVAELIRDIRSRYGNLPLVPHNKYAATRCPGNYDLNKLNEMAKEEDMLTERGLYVIYRLRLGREPDPSAKAHYIGKMTFDQADADVVNSVEYKGYVDQAKNKTLELSRFLSRNYRVVTPPITAKVLDELNASKARIAELEKQLAASSGTYELISEPVYRRK